MVTGKMEARLKELEDFWTELRPAQVDVGGGGGGEREGER